MSGARHRFGVQPTRHRSNYILPSFANSVQMNLGNVLCRQPSAILRGRGNRLLTRHWPAINRAGNTGFVNRTLPWTAGSGTHDNQVIESANMLSGLL